MASSESTAPKIEERTTPLLPGMTLTTPPIVGIIEIVEEELGRRYAARFYDVQHRINPERDLGELMMEAMNEGFYSERFIAFNDNFLRAVLTDVTLTADLIAACLFRNHRDMTAYKIRQLLDSDQLLELRPLAMELFGFKPKEPAPATQPPIDQAGATKEASE